MLGLYYQDKLYHWGDEKQFLEEVAHEMVFETVKIALLSEEYYCHQCGFNASEHLYILSK